MSNGNGQEILEYFGKIAPFTNGLKPDNALYGGFFDYLKKTKNFVVDRGYITVCFWA